MDFKALGYDVSIKKGQDKAPDDIIKRAQELLKKYMRYMEPIQAKWIENEQWYKMQHWAYIKNQKYKNDPEPSTGFVLSTIANKHADAMDFYPKPVIKPRRPEDKATANQLSDIVPVELEWMDFQEVWSNIWYDKLKLGPGIYANIFDPNMYQGIGGNVIKNIDPLNFYCNPFVKKLSESKAVFVTELVDIEDFKRLYPEADPTRAGKLFEPKRYITGEPQDTADMILVIDMYYLDQNSTGETVVHLLKFAGDEKLYYSPETEDYSEGYYNLEEYPFEIDALYPEKDNIFGFGLIDVVKNPQIYVDKLDQIILTNTFAHSRKRYLYKDNANISEQDFLDPSKVLVRASSISEDSIRELTATPTDTNVYAHRATKIAELKETSTANEFSRGETNSGVTAAQAIVALQKASGKTSRAAITQSYSVFSKVVYKHIELMRQFYDIPRDYRIEDKDQEDGYRFEQFSNEALLGERKPIFDFKVEAEKQDPFSQAAQNELAKEMYQMGFFDPQRALMAQTAMTIMDFDGKDQLLEMIMQNAQIQEQLMMGQEAMLENQKLKAIVQATTGQDLGVDMGQFQKGGQQ